MFIWAGNAFKIRSYLLMDKNVKITICYRVVGLRALVARGIKGLKTLVCH